MKHKTDLVIVTREPFPLGMAASNRIISYAKEIAIHKQVTVLLTQPSEFGSDIKNTNAKGCISSVNYKYLHNTTIWPKDSPKYKKAIIIIQSYFFLIRELYSLKPKSVLLVSNDIKLIWYLFLLSKMLSFNYFQEKSEKPPVIKTKVHSLYKKFYLFSYRLFTGMIVMTNELKELFLSLKQKQIFLLPMTVDIDRFKKTDIQTGRSKYFFKYCGGGTYERDGLYNMVLAFIETRKFYTNFEFHIIGPYDNQSVYVEKIFQVIQKNDANSFIKFNGAKSANEIPDILFDADFLIMTPPENYASGGFPTKLGEYLATAKPVICTSVSEIPLYLNDKNAIIVEPDNHDALVTTLCNVLKSPDGFRTIGEQGRITVEKYFTMGSQTNNLIKFLKL